MDSEENDGYGTQIRRFQVIFAIPGVILGLGGSIYGLMHISEIESVKAWVGVLVAPFSLGAAGSALGMCLACAAAPTEYLKGPSGEKWMSMIGTQNVTVARIACLVLGVLITAMFSVMTWLLVWMR